MAKARKDERGRALRKGEVQRASDKRYMYTYTDPLGRRKFIYANDLTTLREKEKQLMKDQLDGLDIYVAGKASVNDYLLKGDSPMKNYLDYIEESTNVVKSKVKLSKLILILSYLVIWAFNIMVSWFFSAESISEAQAGAFQWLVLPVATIVISLLIGKNDFWGKRKWFAPIGFGLMFLLSIYASYGMRENSIFNQINLQTITLFFIGAIASVIGIVLGYAFFTVEKNTPKSE